MMRSVGVAIGLGLLMAAGGLWTDSRTAWGQDASWRHSAEGARPAAPDQPVQPQLPTIQRRPPAPPFVLTPPEQAQLDWVLRTWEQRCDKIKMFECDFTRFDYDAVFGDGSKPKYTDQGSLKYAAPDKGLFRVEKPRDEKWICNGKAVYEYRYQLKELIEHRLPPELQGKDISNGPLPFLFGAKAEQLKQRYFLRLITPQEAAQEQIWLEAYPRFQGQAADFSKAELILTTKDFLPYALKIYLPNGKNRTVYAFQNIVLNNPLRILSNPFQASKPSWDWKLTVEDASPPAQASRAAPPGRK